MHTSAYTVDEFNKVITHHLEGALFPNWDGTSQERFFSFEDGRLKLSTAPIEYAGDTVTAVMVWERL